MVGVGVDLQSGGECAPGVANNAPGGAKQVSGNPLQVAPVVFGGAAQLPHQFLDSELDVWPVEAVKVEPSCKRLVQFELRTSKRRLLGLGNFKGRL